MAASLRTLLARGVSRVLPAGLEPPLLRLFCRPFARQLTGSISDDFLESLLRVMDLAFILSPGYRRNIRGFDACYVFRTADDPQVACSAVFHDGAMAVREEATAPYNVQVTFATSQALWKFLFSPEQDIIDSILANEVTTDGNLNYIYKFGFMARDLLHRLGIG